jgi:glutathione peroxidase
MLSRRLSLPILAASFAACHSSDPQQAPPQPSDATSGPAAEAAASPTTRNPAPIAMDFYSLKVRSLEGQVVDLAQYRGKVTLVVNVASECGFTPQYAGLQKLHAELKDRGFAVLGFPSNDFGKQEPGTPTQIRAFCTETYHVDFPMFEKLQTKAGAGQSAVYELLGEASGRLPSWNSAYVVSKDGSVRQFFDSKATEQGSGAIDSAMKSGTRAMRAARAYQGEVECEHPRQELDAGVADPINRRRHWPTVRANHQKSAIRSC